MNASAQRKPNVVSSIPPRLEIQGFRDYQFVTPQDEAVCILFIVELT